MNGLRSTPRRFRWLLPGLLLLSAIPVLAGIARLVSLARRGPVTPENERFFAAPLPIVLHVTTVLAFAVLGALQVTWGLSGERRALHRRLGPGVWAAGIMAALSGLWLTLTYPHVPGDGPALYWTRLVVGALMVVELAIAAGQAWRHRFREHGAWALRAYALGMGAGTQALVHLPWLLLVGPTTVTSRGVLMGLGWLVNALAAEAWLWRQARRQSRSLLQTSEGLTPN